MSLAALSFILRSLIAIGFASEHSTSPTIGASLSPVACVAQKANQPSPVPDHDEEPSCCLLFGARDCNALQAACDLLSASVTEFPEFRPEGCDLGPVVDKRGGRPTGWASSWSPRAPPLFS